MNDRLSALLTEAQSLPDLRRPSWAKYAPIVRTLRAKGMTYRAVYDWLIERGEPLEPTPIMVNRFRAALSTKEAASAKANAKAAQKAKGGPQ